MKLQSSILGKNVFAFLALAAGVVDAAAQTGVFRLTSQNYTVKEAGPVARITVSRTGGSSGMVTVGFQTVDQANEAMSGVDYLPTNGSLTFPQGVTSQSFDVPILQDAVHETNQTVLVELTGVEGGTASLGSVYFAVITITDDDPCRYVVTPSTRTHDSKAGVFSFNVTAPEGCPLAPVSNVSWLGVNSVDGGQVVYSLDANTGRSTRTGRITVGNKSFTLTQLSQFTELAGSYSGLFREESGTRQESSGAMTAKISKVGAFSAKVLLAGKRLSFSGQLNLDGKITNVLDRTAGGDLIIMFGVEFGSGGLLTGTITDGNWTASLTGIRAFADYRLGPLLQAGRYTLLMPGDDENAAIEPGGDSYGSASVDARGRAKFQLILADGTIATQKVSAGTNGWCPIYVPLYKSAGSIQGWAVFADAGDSDLGGTLAWIKPILPTAKYYSNGFALAKDFSGARYRASTNEQDRLLPFISGHLAFSAVNFAPPFENAVGVSASGTVTNEGTHRMTFTLSRSTGLFRGTVTPPDTVRSVPFKGAIHRGLGIGSGHFLGTGQSGRVELAE